MRFFRLPLLLAVMMAGAPAMADVTPKDMAIAGRILGVLQSPMTGDIRIGIVSGAGNAQSAKEAEALTAILGSGLKAGNATFKPVPLDLAKLDGAAVDVLFLTSGLAAEGAKVGAFAKDKKLLCLTTDLAAAQAGYCAVNIQSEPKVQITVNKSAADAAGISFAAAFKMMITEI